MTELIKLMRPELVKFTAYRSARFEYSGVTQIQLDANENPYLPYGENQLALNRYPQQQPEQLRAIVAALYGECAENILLTRGMDEGIDLLIRLFCCPYQDNIATITPTFGYYAVAARLNAVNVINFPLDENFMPDWSALKACQQLKMLFLCTPNNPTGNILPIARIEELSQALTETVIVVDEAYLEFSDAPSMLSLRKRCPNVIVTRTLSKAYALAGVRLGVIIADPAVIQMLQTIMPPYPIATPCIISAQAALSPLGIAVAKSRIATIKQQRDILAHYLPQSPYVVKVYPSEANFILLEMTDAKGCYQQLKQRGIIVRDRSDELANTLRISVGNEEENRLLLQALDVVLPTQEVVFRQARTCRKTTETEIYCEVKLSSIEPSQITTGIAFFDHMLMQLARHSGSSFTINARGDLEVDAHHTVEDVAIVLGETLKKALMTKLGIARYGYFQLPMDEAMANVSIDLSGRSGCYFSVAFPAMVVEQFPLEMVKHFFTSLSFHLGATLHISATGENSHHLVEAIFKGVARALKQAITVNDSLLPSTKGTL